MKNSLVSMLAVAQILLLGGCGWLGGEEGIFRDRGNDYRRARIDPALTIPAGLDNAAIDDRFAIPEIEERSVLSGEFKMPRPEPLDRDADRDSVVISRFGDDQWILVNGTPGAIWPRLRLFLIQNNIEVLRADAMNGLLDTAWLNPQDAPKERYRLRVDQGVQRSTTEVYVTQVVQTEGNDWPAVSSNPEREDVMVQALAQYLADSSAASTVSMLAERAHDTGGKVVLDVSDEGEPSLNLALPYERGWASLTNALAKAEFTIDDRDHSQGLLYVRHKLPDDDEDDDDGWFSGWFSSDDDEEDAGYAYLITVEKVHSQLMRITIKRQNDGAKADGEEEKLLKLIKRNIS